MCKKMWKNVELTNYEWSVIRPYVTTNDIKFEVSATNDKFLHIELLVNDEECNFLNEKLDEIYRYQSEFGESCRFSLMGDTKSVENLKFQEEFVMLSIILWSGVITCGTMVYGMLNNGEFCKTEKKNETLENF